MNVRDDNNEVLKRAEKGYYNVLGWKDANGYRWYEVEKGKYIANVESRVVYIPKVDSDVITLQNRVVELENELADLKNVIKEIRTLSEKIS